MSTDKPDPRIPPVGVYDYDEVEPVPNERRSIALGLPPDLDTLGRTPGGLNATGPTPAEKYAAAMAAQRISWSADHIAMIDAGDNRLELSIGYTCTLTPEPTRWQRFKDWVARLFGGRS